MLIVTTTHVIDESDRCNTNILITLSFGVQSTSNAKSTVSSLDSSSKTSEVEESIRYELHDGTLKVRTVPSLCRGDN